MFVFNHLIPDVQLDGKFDQKNFPLVMIHIKEFIFISPQPPHRRFKFSIRNFQCFRFIFYRNWKIPVWVLPSLYPPSILINIEWLEKWWNFLHTSKSDSFYRVCAQSSRLIPMEKWLKCFSLIGKNRSRENYSDKWRGKLTIFFLVWRK